MMQPMLRLITLITLIPASNRKWGWQNVHANTMLYSEQEHPKLWTCRTVAPRAAKYWCKELGLALMSAQKNHRGFHAQKKWLAMDWQKNVLALVCNHTELSHYFHFQMSFVLPSTSASLDAPALWQEVSPSVPCQWSLILVHLWSKVTGILPHIWHYLPSNISATSHNCSHLGP